MLLAGLLTVATSWGCQPPDRQRSTVSFREVLADAEIGAVLNHNILVTEVQAWHGGITATYRPERAQPLLTILDEARFHLGEGFRRALAANGVRLRHFAAHHDRAELELDSTVREELTALLNLRESLEAGFEASASGAPLIHGLQIEGDCRLSPKTGHVHEGPVIKPVEYVGLDLQQHAPGRDLSILVRALAEFAAESRPGQEQARPSRALTSHAPPPVVPAWWPQQGDLFYDGDRFLDSTMKWPTIDIQPSDPQAGYEHSLVVGRNFLQGCTTMTTLENGYAQCDDNTWGHDPELEVHRIGTRTLNDNDLTPGRRYWGMWSFTSIGSEQFAVHRLTGRQTTPSSGCASTPCFETRKRAWFISKGYGEFERGQMLWSRWLPDQVWDASDRIPNEE